MEKKNNCVKAGSLRILWTVTTILLCASLCNAGFIQVEPGEVEIIDTVRDDQIYVTGGTVVLKPYGYAIQGIYAASGSEVKISGCDIVLGQTGTPVQIEPNVIVTLFTDRTGSIVLYTAYGPDATLGGTTITVDPTNGWTGKLTWEYEETTYSLNISTLSNITIEIVGGGDGITVNIENAKICWHHSDIHVEGKLYLPQGVWMDNLEPVGSAVIILAEVEVVDPEDQSVAFATKGKDGKKWEYKDKKNIDGPIKEFKIDWKGAKFDYKGDEGLHINTHFIGGIETTLCIHSDDTLWPFTVIIDETTTIDYDEGRSITTDVEYESQKDDNTHVHFTLPFQLTSDMTVEVSGTAIFVEDYYKEGVAKFKIVSAFDSLLLPDGTDSSPDELEIEISLGEVPNTISGSDLIDAWTNKDDKHWEYKL